MNDYSKNPYALVTPRMASSAVGTWGTVCDDGRIVTVNDPDAPPHQFKVGDRVLLVSWSASGWVNTAHGILGHPGWAPDGDYDMDGGLYRIVVRDGVVTQTLVNESKRTKAASV